MLGSRESSAYPDRLIIKVEHLSDYNQSGSMYDRLYAYLFRQWEEKGLIVPGKEGTPVIECSAGNAGAAFCHAAAKLGFGNHTLFIPADIYAARIEQVASYGDNIVLSPSGEGELGYIRMIGVCTLLPRPQHIACGAVEDYPRTLEEFEGRFATEQACREYLMQLRWPQGFVCPRCGGRRARPAGGACCGVGNAIIRLR